MPTAKLTRVRVDDYTYIHAVAEGPDGMLYAAQRFIKASGGCSAPAGKDQTAALQRLGRMKMSFKDAPRLGEPGTAQLPAQASPETGLNLPRDPIVRLEALFDPGTLDLITPDDGAGAIAGTGLIG